MSTHDPRAVLETLSAAEQVQLLSLFGHELTILARTAYELQGAGVENPRLLRDINEIQHRVHAQIFALLRRNTSAFPPETMASWILGEGKPHLHAGLAYAFDRSLYRFRTVA